ncbi:hypothetical protein, partial [Amycolatopsis speibonae]
MKLVRMMGLAVLTASALVFSMTAASRRACHGNRVSQRCTKIDSLVWRSEGTSSDSGHIVSS